MSNPPSTARLPAGERRTSRYKRPESVLVVVYTAAEILALRRRQPP